MAEYIDDFSLVVLGCSWLLKIVEVDVSVEHVLRGEFLQEPAVAVESTMTGILPVLQVAGRGVGQEDVNIAAIPELVQQEPGKESQELELHC